MYVHLGNCGVRKKKQMETCKKNGKKHQFQLSAGILLFAMNNVVKESPFLVLLSNDKGSSTTGVGALVLKFSKFLLYISIWYVHIKSSTGSYQMDNIIKLRTRVCYFHASNRGTRYQGTWSFEGIIRC